MITVADLAADQGADGIFCFYICFISDGITQVCFGAVVPNGSTVGFGGIAFFFELVQITANGFFRNSVMRCKLRNNNTLLRSEFIHDFFFSFYCKHRNPSFQLAVFKIPHKTTLSYQKQHRISRKNLSFYEKILAIRDRIC